MEYLKDQNRGIKRASISFYIDDYIFYDKLAKSQVRLRELYRKQNRWEAINQEIALKQKIGLEISEYTWSTYVTGRLTGLEECELNDLERVVDESLMELDLKDLSLEQWSFIKSLNEGMNESGLLQMISSLSDPFLNQLSLNETDTSVRKELISIQNKYINHCNLISEGVIKFIQKEPKIKEDNAE